MKREVKNKPASIKAKLLNLAKAEKVDFDAFLLRYFQERFLYRLSICEFSERFVLKGGLLLICLKFPRSRPTKDIDLLARHIKNAVDELKHIFKDITKIPCDDGIKFDPSTIQSERIKEETDYEGIRLKITGYLGKMRKRIQIDIGFGDMIIPKATYMDFPTLLGDMPPRIKVYSLESIIAEKFEATVKLSVINSRMKDFYDIYMLSSVHNFIGNTLKNAVENTFRARKTILPQEPLVFRSEFHKDKGKQQQWSAFLRKTRLPGIEQDFSTIMEKTTTFLKPIVLAINNKNKIDRTWNAQLGLWEK